MTCPFKVLSKQYIISISFHQDLIPFICLAATIVTSLIGPVLIYYSTYVLRSLLEAVFGVFLLSEDWLNEPELNQ